tara:strand:- start:234 stop:341 length:108 start_codon:yes stop_codon:yes gene_type:complete
MDPWSMGAIVTGIVAGTLGTLTYLKLWYMKNYDDV